MPVTLHKLVVLALFCRAQPSCGICGFRTNTSASCEYKYESSTLVREEFDDSGAISHMSLPIMIRLQCPDAHYIRRKILRKPLCFSANTAWNQKLPRKGDTVPVADKVLEEKRGKSRQFCLRTFLSAVVGFLSLPICSDCWRPPALPQPPGRDTAAAKCLLAGCMVHVQCCPRMYAGICICVYTNMPPRSQRLLQFQA